ncbi:glutamate-rich protein 3 isoform X2 [Mesocricetus auratus]|uniref:Glutamate-rich protein 3 isoform X2 n=1 Tax=Mesocricetus auratus TaxID=10036 RepID=A0A1U8CGJ0_MESAU|nr:glutamate-rich protein 3 isoform X2 [Mesocricetus auratus]
MSHSHPAGLLATYNSLTDKHLAGYFNNTRIRRHLLRSGLITRSGRILSEKEYKVNTMKQDHQKYIRECLAQAIFHKVLDMERNRQLEIRRKLDALARKERIQRLKGEHTRRFIEDNLPVLTPHPPAGPKSNRGCSVLAEEGHSSPLTLTASSRPYTAPGNMQPPIRLQPLLSNCAARNVSKITSGSKLKTAFLESEAPFPIGGKKAMMKFRNSMDNSQRLDPYQLPDINSYQFPVPPTSPPQTGKIFRENRSEPWRRKKLRPITAPHGLEPLYTRDPGRIYKTAPHSNAVITMVYFGKNVHLSYDDTDFRDEVKIYQQHCGGENLCIYKGKLLEKDTFQFISKRHHGFPFSLTFFLNGIQVNRLSSCCEYKHRRSSRLGGKRGYFGFVSVEKAFPCYRCIIAMGLDRKPSPTKPRKEKTAEKREEPLRRGQGKLRKDRENASSRRSEMERRKEASVSATCSAEEIKSGVREVRTAIEEMEWKGRSEQDAWEEDQENTFKYDYEEDFEIDEEKQDEVADDGDEVGDQVSRTSKSPTEEETHNPSPGTEIEISSEKAPDVYDNENREDDGCLDSDEDRQDIKTVSSVSSRSQAYSSESEDDSTEVGVEGHSENSTGDSSRSSSSQDLRENDDRGKFHFPVEESLETEIEEQEVTKVVEDNGPPSTEVSCAHVAEEDPRDRTQELAESRPKMSGQSASPEAKAGGTLLVEDRKEGFPGLEEEVGQIIGEAQPPGHYCSDTAAELSTTEDGATPTRKPEVNLAGVAEEERASSGSKEQPQQAAQEVCTPEKETASAAAARDEYSQPEDALTDAGLREKAWRKEDEAHRPQDADMNAELREGVGVAEVPTGKRSPAEEQQALAEQSSEEGERPLSTASQAEAGSEGHSRCGEGWLNPTGKVGVSVPQRDVDPDGQALLQTDMEKGRAGSVRGRVLEEAVLSSEMQGESTFLKEAGPPEMEEAEREVGSPRPDGDQGREGAPTELEAMEPVEDTAPETGHGFEEATLGGGKAATERKEVLEAADAPSSSSAGASPREDAQDSPEALWKEDTAREGAMADTESTQEGDPRAVLPGEFAASGDWKTVERRPTPLREAGSEREEVTGWTEEKLGEQRVRGEEAGTGEEVGCEEEERFEEEAGTGEEVRCEEEAGTVKEVKCEEEAGTGEEVGCEEEAGTVKEVKCEEEAGTVEEVGCEEEAGTVEEVGCEEEAGTGEEVGCEEEAGTGEEVGCEEEAGTVEEVRCEEEAGTGEEVGCEEEAGTGEEVRSGEDAHASPNKTDADAEAIDPARATKLSENPRLLEDSPRARTIISLSEARLQSGKSLAENEATVTEEPADKARVPENVFTAGAQEWAAPELDSLEGPERPDGESPSSRGILMTHGSLPGERVTVAAGLSGETEREKPQEEGGEDRKHPPGTATASLAGQDRAMGRGAGKDEEGPRGGRVDGTAAGQREGLAESVSVASSSADGHKEPRSRAGEAPGGEAAAEGRVIAEDVEPGPGKEAVVVEVTSAGTVETTQEQKTPDVQDSEGGEERASQ